jgi:hypothetical protein
MTPMEALERVFRILEGVEFDFRAQRELHALKAEIDASPVVPVGASPVERWQPIETAPKNTTVLVWAVDMGWAASGPVVAWDRGKGWHSQPGCYTLRPTHWQPLPDPPALSSAQEPTP